ncbi:MAG: hypothetical protein ACRDJ2_09840 [Actinomycetota bacterium]
MHEQATDTRPEIEAVRCPNCGGLNRAGAEWCGQCLDRFAPPSGPVGVSAPSPQSAIGAPPPPPPPPGFTAPQPTVSSGAITVGKDGITWTCKECDTANPFDAQECSVCGTPFGALLREPEPERPTRDPNAVALISLFFPGAGHGYLGLWGQAIARAIVSAWVMLVTIVAGVQGGVGFMTFLFGAIAFGLWLVAAHDAYREATGATGEVLLKNGYFLWVVLGILALMMGMFVMQALQANAAA